ncbi:MAG: hypothetical protein PF693_03425, partial [Spirochaetia bacterium]|nr:hypothetical protein [Spirochaetia bacterium]
MTVKYHFIVLLILLTSFQLSADVKKDIQGLVENFSLEYKNKNPDLVFRPNIGILPFSNKSEDAEKYGVGEAVSTLIENTFFRSLLFSVIDDRIRDKHRVGGGQMPAVLSQNRAYGSVHGSSCHFNPTFNTKPVRK